KAAETSFLPGTAGSRSEQQTPTGEVQMGRTTGPVEEEAKADQARTASGELAQEPVIGSTSVPSVLKEPPLAEREATLSFGSESPGQTQASESKTEFFVSPQAPHAHPKDLQDQAKTQQFVPDQWSDSQATREFQSPGRTVPADIAASSSSTQPA